MQRRYSTQANLPSSCPVGVHQLHKDHLQKGNGLSVNIAMTYISSLASGW